MQQKCPKCGHDITDPISTETKNTTLPKMCWTCNYDKCAESQYRAHNNMTYVCNNWKEIERSLDHLMEDLEWERKDLKKDIKRFNKKLNETNQAINLLEEYINNNSKENEG